MVEPEPARRRKWWQFATVDITPLRRHRDYRLLVAARMISFFGSMITYVAVPFQVYQLSHSTLLVGALGLVELAALLVFAMLGGALADATDRRLMVLLGEAGLMAGSLVLAGNAALTHPMLWLIFAVVLLGASLDAFERPSLDALIPRLVERDEMTAAGALGMLSTTIGLIAGPAVAGVLIATAGLPITYLVDVATFVAGLACLSLMKAVPPPADAERPSVRRVLEGVRYARSRQELIGTYLVDIVAMLFGMPTALFPAIAQGLGGPKVLGLLYAGGGRRVRVLLHQRLDPAGSPPWDGGDRGGNRVGPCDHRLWARTRSGRGTVLPGFGRRSRRNERRVSLRDLEPDDPRLAARAAGIDRAAQLLHRSDAGQLGSGRGGFSLQRADLDSFGRHPHRCRVPALRRCAAGLQAVRRAPVASGAGRLAV